MPKQILAARIFRRKRRQQFFQRHHRQEDGASPSIRQLLYIRLIILEKGISRSGMLGTRDNP
jgi:hypothetical protein